MIARLITAAFLAWCTPLVAADAAYCAFEVKVRNPSNIPSSKVPVGIAQGRVTLSETTTDASGTAKICDAPLNAVDIFIGFDACGLVLIKQVKPLWLQTKRLFVTYAQSSCEEFIFAKNCHILLRVKDESSRPVAGARFEGQTSEAVREPVLSDAFGRLFRAVEGDRKLEGLVSKEGYEPAPISRRCLLREADVDIELMVVLRKY